MTKKLTPYLDYFKNELKLDRREVPDSVYRRTRKILKAMKNGEISASALKNVFITCNGSFRKNELVWPAKFLFKDNDDLWTEVRFVLTENDDGDWLTFSVGILEPKKPGWDGNYVKSELRVKKEEFAALAKEIQRCDKIKLINKKKLTA